MSDPTFENLRKRAEKDRMGLLVGTTPPRETALIWIETALILANGIEKALDEIVRASSRFN